MRILHIINDLNNGGAERLLVDILPLQKNTSDLEISVLQLSDRNSVPEYIEILREAGIKVYSISGAGIYRIKLFFELRKFILSHRFSILHVHLFPAMYYMAFASVGTGAKMVFTEHSTQNRRWKKKYLKPLEGFVYNRYKNIIAISPSIQRKLIAWTGLQTKIVLIRNGVDIKKFKDAVPYNHTEFSLSLNIPAQSFLILMTARFIYPKDHFTVIDALAFLPSNFHVIFAGGAGDLDKAKDYTKKNGKSGRVHFLGFRSDIPQLMKTVDLNVLSSFYEGMSGVTCEALSSGKPFLGSDVVGINDVVPDKRYLFEKQNPKMLADKIKEICTDKFLAMKMGEDGKEFVSQFNVEIMLDELLKLYKRL